MANLKTIVLLFVAIVLFSQNRGQALDNWSQIYDGTITGSSTAATAVLTSSHHTIVSGVRTILTSNSLTYLLWIAELDQQSGGILWERFYDLGQQAVNAPVFETPDGNLLVLTTLYTAGGNRGLILKLDLAGNFLWEMLITSGNLERVVSVAFLGNDYVVEGTTATFNNNVRVPADTLLVKLDGSTGQTIWQQTYSGTPRNGGKSDLYGSSVTSVADGGLLLTGSSYASGSKLSDYWISKLDALGTVVWSRLFSAALFDDPVSGVQTPDGGYLTFGTTTSFGPYPYGNLVLMKVDSNGKLIWQKVYGFSDRQLIATDFRPLNNGSYLLEATSYDNTNDNRPDGVLIDVSGLGEINWAKAITPLQSTKWNTMSSVSENGDDILAAVSHSDTGFFPVQALLLNFSSADGSSSCNSIVNVNLIVGSGGLGNTRDLPIKVAPSAFSLANATLQLAADQTTSDERCN